MKKQHSPPQCPLVVLPLHSRWPRTSLVRSRRRRLKKQASNGCIANEQGVNIALHFVNWKKSASIIDSIMFKMNYSCFHCHLWIMIIGSFSKCIFIVSMVRKSVWMCVIVFFFICVIGISIISSTCKRASARRIQPCVHMFTKVKCFYL